MTFAQKRGILTRGKGFKMALFNLSTALYWVPMLALLLAAALHLLGVDIDALGAFDDMRKGWKRLFFPKPDLRGITAALMIVGWSATGAAFHHLVGESAGWTAHIAIAGAALAAGWGLGAGGTLLIDLAFPAESRPVRKADLIGTSAVIISSPVKGELGRARIQLPQGGSITVFCKNIGGGIFPQEGERVTIAAYDEETNTFDIF